MWPETSDICFGCFEISAVQFSSNRCDSQVGDERGRSCDAEQIREQCRV